MIELRIDDKIVYFYNGLQAQIAGVTRSLSGLIGCRVPAKANVHHDLAGKHPAQGAGGRLARHQDHRPDGAENRHGESAPGAIHLRRPGAAEAVGYPRQRGAREGGEGVADLGEREVSAVFYLISFQLRPAPARK